MEAHMSETVYLEPYGVLMHRFNGLKRLFGVAAIDLDEAETKRLWEPIDQTLISTGYPDLALSGSGCSLTLARAINAAQELLERLGVDPYAPILGSVTLRTKA
jgi:hypothetical protein